MSELQSEKYDRRLDVRVRVKLVDLDNEGKLGSIERVSKERVASIVGLGTDRASHGRVAETQTQPAAQSHGEICMHTGARVALSDFESHIEECTVCANRVELQLDFIQTLETAIFQRHGDPDSEKIHGALLIGAPKLNFAICGEIKFN